MSLLQMSFSGGIMIIVIVILRALAINKLPKKVFGLLWGAVLIRLLIPFSIPTMLSAYSLVNNNEPIQTVIANTPAEYMIPQIAAVQSNANAGAAEALQSQVPAISGWAMLWIGGSFLCACFFLITYLRGLLEFRTSLPVSNDYAAKWLQGHRLVRNIQIRQSDRIAAPLTYGILMPVILMPQKTDWEDGQQLQYVLSHEYVHIRRFDMVWKLVAALALCIHWFNPLVWVMYILFNRDIELSCDERVVRQYGEKARTVYAKTLLTMEEKKSGLMPLCNNFSKNAIEERITAIMKIKKITLWAVMMSTMVLVAVVVLFATTAEGKPLSDAENQEMEADGETAGGMVAEGVEAPDSVLMAAQQLVGQIFTNMQDGDYSNWRVESLEHAYTYDDFDGMTLQIYQMNYEFFAEDPEKAVLAGGMSVDEDGWVVPGYPNSTFLIFRQEGNALTYLTSLMENDCFPGDEVFDEDLRWMLGASGEAEEETDTNVREVRENEIMIPFEMAGNMEEMPAKLYIGEGFSIYIPDGYPDDWQINDESLEGSQLMTAVSGPLSIGVAHYTDETVVDVTERFLSEGYTYDPFGTGNLQKFEGLETMLLVEQRIYGTDNDVWVVSSQYSTEVEWGSRINAIADTFAFTVNYGENDLANNLEEVSAQLNETARELEELMTLFCTAYFEGDDDTVKGFLVNDYEWNLEVYGDAAHADEVEIIQIKGLQQIDEGNLTDHYNLSLEIRISGEDSLTYLSVTWENQNGSWKVRGYGLEK